MPHNCGVPQLLLPDGMVWTAPLCSLSTPVDKPAKLVKCDPTQMWAEWKVDIRRPQTDWRTSRRELIIKIETACSMSRMGRKTRQPALALIDSGARIPLAMRIGLFPKERLQKAQFPVAFTTADGSPMTGGTHGVFLGLCLPVRVDSGDSKIIRTYPIFAYEAPLHGVDLIIGYPFLKAFDLVLDAVTDCLVHGPLCRRALRTAPGPHRGTVTHPAADAVPECPALAAPRHVASPSACISMLPPMEPSSSVEPLPPQSAELTPSPEELRCLLLHEIEQLLACVARAVEPGTQRPLY